MPDELPQETGTESLARIVAESSDTLKNADAPPIKRGRGKRGPDRHARRRASPTEEIEGPTTASVATDSPPVGPSPLLPTVKMLVKVPFEIKKKNSGFDGWALSDPEADALAIQTDSVIQWFTPSVGNSKWGALAMLGLTALVMVGHRMLAEDEYRVNKAKQVEGSVENANQNT